jgi:peptide/nickel transport system substrate-binding protein
MARRNGSPLLLTVSFLTLSLLAVAAPALSQESPTPRVAKPGGVVNMMLREDLAQGFSIHETATLGTVFPSMPCLSNLVIFDPLKRMERPETIIGELAERWSWQDGSRSLVFFLRGDVRWHDGQPFTSRDVKYTFDMIREAPDAQARLRINPRKDWYANVDGIEAPDPRTVVFHLRRPQPSLLMLLASGYSPIYPAHVPPAEFRTRCVGTGPFKLKEWKRGESVEYVRNPDYFVKGRPYLDGIKYHVIVERGTRIAALKAGRVDATLPADGTKAIADQVRAAVPGIVVTPTANNGNDNLLINQTRPPFNDPKVRLAVTRAIDRRAYVQAVAQGSAVVGGALLPRPSGVWGLAEKDLEGVPGYGPAAREKAEARKLLAEAGHGPGNPLRIDLATRAVATYVDLASFIVNELRQVGLEVTLRQVETAQWHPMLMRKDFQAGANGTGFGVDDPDGVFYENYACGSLRNLTGYCNETVMKLIDAQSQTIDPAKRRELVNQIQRRLEEDVARPIMGWRTDHFLNWPRVKNLVPHQVTYNWGRMQEVWVDK